MISKILFVQKTFVWIVLDNTCWKLHFEAIMQQTTSYKRSSTAKPKQSSKFFLTASATSIQSAHFSTDNRGAMQTHNYYMYLLLFATNTSSIIIADYDSYFTTIDIRLSSVRRRPVRRRVLHWWFLWFETNQSMVCWIDCSLVGKH